MKLDSLRVVRTMTAVTLAFTGLAAIVSAADAAKTAQAAVINLNSKNYKAWTATRDLALVEFYAPWCSYCQAMAPGYESAAAELKDDGIALAKVDCTKESEICEMHNIEGYPTLKVIDNGVFAAYNGTRQQNSIVEYMRKRKLPAVEEVTSKTFDKFTNSGHIVVVGFFGEKSAELETLKTVANELRDEYTFGYTTDKTLAAKQGVAFPGLAIYKGFDTHKDEFEATTNVSLLRASVRSSSVPLMGELSAQTFVTYARAGIPIGLVFYDSAESRKELESELLSLATRYRRWVSMALVDANVYRKHAKSINLKEKWPAFAIQDINKQFKYIHPQDKPLTKDTVGDFVADFFNDKLAPDYKTQVIFGPNDGGVYDLVASKFKEVVFDKSKDVLIEFYAPWCIYCKRMAEAYTELGETFKENKNMVIAKMDATENDIPSSDPGLQFPGFPTIVLVRAGDNRIIRYNGNRTHKSFVAFIKDHAVHSGDHAEIVAEGAADEKPVYFEAPSHAVGFTPKETRHIEL